MKPRAAAVTLGLAAILSCGAAEPGRADELKHSTAVFAGLDKITGRIISFEVAINETVQFGLLQITPRVCYSRPTTEAPRTDGFLDVYEVDPDQKDKTQQYKKIFSGWMFADSPGLNGVEHPIYDVWLTDCRGSTQLISTPPDLAEENNAPPAATPVPAANSPAGTPPAAPRSAPQPRRPGAAPTDSAAVVPSLGPPVYVPSASDSVSATVPASTLPAGTSGTRPLAPRPPGRIPNAGRPSRYYPPDPDNPYGNY
jgi:hypothetical protein